VSGLQDKIKEEEMIKKHKLWVLIAVIVIATMSLFACTPAETLEPTEAPPETVATEHHQKLNQPKHHQKLNQPKHRQKWSQLKHHL
jgi:hypothetical protein